MPSRNSDLPLAVEIRLTEERLRIYDGLARAVAEPHAVLDIVFHAEDPDAAAAALRDRFSLDSLQATAVMDLQFRRTTRLDRSKIDDQRRQLAQHAKFLNALTEE